MSGANALRDASAAEAPRLNELGGRFGRLAAIVGGIGVLASLGLGYLEDDGFARWQHSWLLACMYFLSISLGALFFVLIQHVTKAGWSVVVRRVAEFLAASTWIVGLLLVPIVVLVFRENGALFPWADTEAVAQDALVSQKTAYLNAPFFAVRLLIYFAAWFLIGRFLWKRSVAQDSAEGAGPTIALERRSPPLVIVYAFTVAFAAFDLLMSLDPAWFSTIFGVYVFAGSVIAFFATTILVFRATQSRGLLKESMGVEHYHDLGKFLFAFVFFWSYIAFSQYMLIWYGDIPEETVWFQHRQHHGWGVASLILLFGHFAIPFAGLLSRHAKRRLRLLTFWAVWLLGMHALDLYWIVMPGAPGGDAVPHLVDGAALLGVGGVWCFAWTRLAARASWVPTGDPRLPESLAFENF